MSENLTYSQWLSKKLFLANLGFYSTIAAVMTLPSVFVSMDIPPLLASFFAFFIVVFIRAGYESLVIYEAKFHQIEPLKMAALSAITATSSSLISFFAKPALGYFAIPVAVMVSMLIVNKIKAILWPAHERQGFFAQMPAALNEVTFARYRFFAILVLGTYFAYGKYGISFPLAFPASFFVGMMVEEWSVIINAYKQKIGNKQIIGSIIWSIICSAEAIGIVGLLKNGLDFPYQTATIIGVLVIKLIQPLGSRKFIVGK